jgi:hypothetical protein
VFDEILFAKRPIVDGLMSDYIEMEDVVFFGICESIEIKL